MKCVKATIAPTTLDEVMDALADVGVPGMTLTEVRRCDRGHRRHRVYRGAPFVVEFAHKIEVEIVVFDDAVSGVVEALEKSSATGATDDGSVSVSEVVEAVRIRTGERGESAIDSPASAVLERAPAKAVAGAVRRS